eukprot:gene23673-9209_t
MLKQGTKESLHGESAAKRQAVTELLFFASVGDLYRCKKITQAWNLQLRDKSTADYDRRTPFVAAWLLKVGADVNPIDRFQRTPLEDAVRGDHGEVATLLITQGAKVVSSDGELIELADSPLAGNVRIFTDYDPEWEIDPHDLTLMEKIGEGEFGIVHKALWHGTTVAVKILKETGAVALGDFRTELNVLQKVHHPHTVQFLGAVTKYQPFMIVTEYMTGGSISDIFRSGNLPNVWRSTQIALDCAKGLAYLHNRTPHALAPKSSSYKLTGETGSYRYMAPEVFRHEQYNNKVDTYGFAMIFYQLLEGIPPFFKMEPMEAARAAALDHKRPEWHAVNRCGEAARAAALDHKLPEWHAVDRAGEAIPEGARRIVEACWAPDHEGRPDLEEVIAELEVLVKLMKPNYMEPPPPATTPTTQDVKPTSASSSSSDGCCAVQ